MPLAHRGRFRSLIYSSAESSNAPLPGSAVSGAWHVISSATPTVAAFIRLAMIRIMLKRLVATRRHESKLRGWTLKKSNTPPASIPGWSSRFHPLRLDCGRLEWHCASRTARMQKESDVTNPFEVENGTYHVLINDEGQHSLWPAFIEVPQGWTIILRSDTRSACLEFINRDWTDMRPKSLIERMKEASESQQ